MEAAIFEDCINLIEKFTENDNPRFESFCEQWKTMMFQHMYSAQTSTIEIIQTTRSILHLAKRILCGKDDVGKVVAKLRDNELQLLRRIGGMYLMYAIYFKQPTKEYVKVLVSPNTWQEILTFINALSMDSRTEEARYIFWRLYKADAFRFTALDYDVGLEDMVDYDAIYDIQRGKEKLEVVRVKLKLKLQAMPEMEKVLPQITELEDKYNDVKQSLAESQKSITKALPPTKIFHDIAGVIKNIHDILDEKPREGDTTKKLDKGNCSKTRKELKRKAAGIVDYYIENEKSNDDDSTAEDTSSLDPNRKRQGRMTARTMIRERLPDHIMEDLKNTSSEDEEDEEENTGENDDDVEQQEDSESEMDLSSQNILPIEKM